MVEAYMANRVAEKPDKKSHVYRAAIHAKKKPVRVSFRDRVRPKRYKANQSVRQNYGRIVLNN
jgi:hypothetical protein